ncbi:MAG: hypothetical protein ACKOTB_03710, partial [Planctomycetia bacterium]
MSLMPKNSGSSVLLPAAVAAWSGILAAATIGCSKPAAPPAAPSAAPSVGATVAEKASPAMPADTKPESEPEPAAKPKPKDEVATTPPAAPWCRLPSALRRSPP